MADFNENLWAPWRMEYIRSLMDEAEEGGCFLCRYLEQPGQDREHHVLWRTDSAIVVMNRFPYTTGHLLIAHTRHQGDMADLSVDALSGMACATRDAVRILKTVMQPQGFNIGYNVGQCAGAGLPDHLHAHIVPRWSGDTNFMPVLGDVRVVPESMDALYTELVKETEKAGLRS